MIDPSVERGAQYKNKSDLRIGVVVPVHNCLEYTKQMMNSFRSSWKYRWIVVDNGSTDGTQEYFESGIIELTNESIRNCDGVKYHRFDDNLGVSKAWNFGIAEAFVDCDLAFVINNDLLFAEDTFDRLMDWYCGDIIISPNNVGNNPKLLRTYSRQRKIIPHAGFYAFLLSRRIINRVGWFDEENFVSPGYFEDNDYLERCAREKVPTFTALDSVVVHFGSRTIREGGVNPEPVFSENEKRFFDKWGYVPDTFPFKKPKLLWVGDAVCESGFWRVGKNVLKRLSKNWDIYILGANYFGDPHEYPYLIYPAIMSGNFWGVKRYRDLVKNIKPNIVLIINNPCIVADFIEEHKGFDIPLVAYMPVDGKNTKTDWHEKLNSLDLAIFYTQFGLDEFREKGYDGSAEVIPHGVDLNLYYPVNRNESRKRLGLGQIEDCFIIGNINSNTFRKRLDLTLYYFSNWIKKYNHENDKIYLYLHCKNKGLGWDLRRLAAELGISGRVIMLSDDSPYYVPEAAMKYVYGALDVQISTTGGEGWGLTTMEGMACGVPQIVPDWSALGEWAKDGTRTIPCSGIFVSLGSPVDVIWGIASENEFLEALEEIYQSKSIRDEFSNKGKELVSQEKYNWDSIGAGFNEILSTYAGNS